MDLLQQGMGWLGDQMINYASQPILYTRGTQTIALSAALGRKLLKLGDEYGGTRVEWTDCDFLIRAADLNFGVRTEPERGDRITVVQDGTTYTYEVLAPGREPAWTWSDPYKQVMRIHGKIVGAT